jgi:S1 RNA binding domain protein
MSVEIGTILQGKVTGITTFGVFVSMENGISGLVHISEISNDYVADINQIVHIGMEVKVKVLSKDDKGKLSLSIKQADGSSASSSSSGGSSRGRKIKEPLDPFEEMMKKFKQQSEEKIHDLKRKENK